MKKLIVAILASMASSALVASEVGASNPSSAAKEDLVVAIAETGASVRWTSEPFEGKATAHDIAELNNRITQVNENISDELTVNLEAKLAEKTRQALEQ